MEPTTLEQLNLMPDITWHFLRMNDTSAKLPQLERAGFAAIDVDAATLGAVTVVTGAATNDLFEATLAQQPQALEQWETGNGPAAEAWLREACSRQVVLEVPKNCFADSLNVRIDAQDGAAAVALVDVVARTGSHGFVNVRVDSPESGSGVAGVFVRVLAEEGAQVQVAVQQTLDATWQYLENIAVYQADDSKVDIRQVELGAAEAYVGVAVNMAGDRSDLGIDLRYYGNGKRQLDFNHIIRQRGVKTNSEYLANGMLTDACRKIMRGTIDLVHGCKGSVGNEREDVLLANEAVRNKTVPIILCDEDDVQGNHGATIGHVNDEQLHYMQSRGLDVDQAEALFSRAIFDFAVSRAADEDAARAVERLAATVLDRPAGE